MHAHFLIADEGTGRLLAEGAFERAVLASWPAAERWSRPDDPETRFFVMADDWQAEVSESEDGKMLWIRGGGLDAGVTVAALALERLPDGRVTWFGDPGGAALLRLEGPCGAAELARRFRLDAGWSTPALEFERAHGDGTQYRLVAGERSIWCDGIDVEYGLIVEIRYAGAPASSPFVDGSGCSSHLRRKALRMAADELRRYRTVIEDPDTPMRGVRVVVDEAAVVPFFERLLVAEEVPGVVEVREP